MTTDLSTAEVRERLVRKVRRTSKWAWLMKLCLAIEMAAFFLAIYREDHFAAVIFALAVAIFLITIVSHNLEKLVLKLTAPADGEQYDDQTNQL